MSRSCDFRHGFWLCTLPPGHPGWHAARAGDEHGFVHCWSDDDDRVAARLAETERRLAVLESTLSGFELDRLAQTPPSSMPDAIEQTEPAGCPKCDGVAWAACRCSGYDETEVCRACQGSGYGDNAAYPCLACDTEPFDAVPRWRRLVDEQHQDVADLRADGLHREVLSEALECLSALAGSLGEPSSLLARIVAECEQEVGDGWKADPDQVPVGYHYWGICGLLLPLSYYQPRWEELGCRAAAWLRSLTEDGAA